MDTITGSAINWNTIVLGRARFRQVRSKPQDCSKPPYSRAAALRNATCYSVQDEMTDPFGPNGISKALVSFHERLILKHSKSL